MALDSVRPISFPMNRSHPLSWPSPLGKPALFASLRPVAYSGSLLKDERQTALKQATAAEQAAYRDGRSRDRLLKMSKDAPGRGGEGGFGGGRPGYADETKRRLEER